VGNLEVICVGSATFDTIASLLRISSKTSVLWRRVLSAEGPDATEAVTLASFVEGIITPALGEEWRKAAERHVAIIKMAVDLCRRADARKAAAPGALATRSGDRPMRLSDIGKRSIEGITGREGEEI